MEWNGTITAVSLIVQFYVFPIRFSIVSCIYIGIDNFGAILYNSYEM